MKLTIGDLIELSNGNPGALAAINQLYDAGHTEAFEYLKHSGIKGTDIYVLWSDICKRDTLSMANVLKAAKDNLIHIDVLRDACSRQDYSGVDLIDLKMINTLYA